MIHVDCYLLDWRDKRPYDFGRETFGRDCLAAFNANRYEYSFSVSVSPGRGDISPDGDQEIAAAEYAYEQQGNNFDSVKIRRDRQSMSVGDAAVVDGHAYVVAGFGFQRVPELDGRLSQRISESWDRWTDDGEGT
jgi:hypothetical protein